MTPQDPPKHVHLKDGRVVLPSNADPAAAGHVVYGWVRHHVGLDLGRNDPSAIVVVRDECYLSAASGDQRVSPRLILRLDRDRLHAFGQDQEVSVALAFDAEAHLGNVPTQSRGGGCPVPACHFHEAFDRRAGQERLGQQMAPFGLR